MKAIAQAEIKLKPPECDPKNLREEAKEFLGFLLLTRWQHVDLITVGGRRARNVALLRRATLTPVDLEGATSSSH